MGEEQLWLKDGWYAKFKRPPDSSDTGVRHSSEDVAAFRSPDVETLLAYHHAVLERSKNYVGSLTDTDLDRKIDHPRHPTVGLRLVAMLNDGLQHAGQVAYIRGLLKGKGWMDV